METGIDLSGYKEYLNSWFDGIISEIQFWENSVLSREGDKHDLVLSRDVEDNNFKLENDLKDISDIGGSIRFLDVGSGPFSRCGGKTTKYRIDFVAVDPLADVYNILKNVIVWIIK